MKDQPFDSAVRQVIYDVLGIDEPASNFIAERLQDVLLRIGQVRNLTGLSNATIYREIDAGSFPEASAHHGNRCRLAPDRHRAVDGQIERGAINRPAGAGLKAGGSLRSRGKLGEGAARPSDAA